MEVLPLLFNDVNLTAFNHKSWGPGRSLPDQGTLWAMTTPFEAIFPFEKWSGLRQTGIKEGTDQPII